MTAKISTGKSSNRRASQAAASKTDRKVNRLRNAIIGSVLIVAALVFAIGVYYTTGTVSGEFTAGEHYRVIEDAPARRPGDPIVVQEFFSYGCVHCRNFDPMIDEWQEQLADDVRFERMPATFSPAWTVLAQTYYALEELGARARNHDRLFRAIHDTGRQFLTIESVADFLDGNGVTRADFLEAANGPAVADRLRKVERAQRTLQISGVPSLVVANRYLVGMDQGRRASLEIADHLIAMERAGVANAAAENPVAENTGPAPADTGSESSEPAPDAMD